MMKTENSINPAGPKGYPFIGSILDLTSRPLKWLQSLTDEYGDVAKFRLLKREVYLVNHPDLVREILGKRVDNYTKKSVAFKIVKVVLGESTFTSTGEVWKRKRKLAQPSFHKNRIANLSVMMTDTIEEMLDEWEIICDKKETINVADAMMRLTLKVVVRALFSTALSKEEVQTVADVFTPLLEETNARISFPIRTFHRLRRKRNAAYFENIKKLDDIIYRIIHERRNASSPPTDLLQMLMDARDEETGEPLNDEELRDEVMTVFIAGHETTANAMAWLWMVLSQQPDVRNRVEEEVEQVLGKRIPVASDFPDLPYLLKVFKETLRIYPPVPILPRRVEQDDVLGDYFIKGGSEVFFSPYLLHRHPDFWEDPESFNPDRFDKDLIRRQHTFAYLPFGGGPRLCMGNNFAMMEAVFIIAMATQRFRLNLVSDAPNEPLVTLTTRPKGGVVVRLERR